MICRYQTTRRVKCVVGGVLYTHDDPYMYDMHVYTNQEEAAKDFDNLDECGEIPTIRQGEVHIYWMSALSFIDGRDGLKDRKFTKYFIHKVGELM